MPAPSVHLPRLVLAMLLAATAGLAGAQQVFRIVGPDGKVTFSDKPPAEPGARAALAGGADALAPVPPVLTPKQLKLALLALASEGMIEEPLPSGTPNLLIFNNYTRSDY